MRESSIGFTTLEIILWTVASISVFIEGKIILLFIIIR